MSPLPSSVTCISTSAAQLGCCLFSWPFPGLFSTLKTENVNLIVSCPSLRPSWSPSALQMKTNIPNVASHALGILAPLCPPDTGLSPLLTAPAALASPYLLRHSGSLHILFTFSETLSLSLHLTVFHISSQRTLPPGRLS